MRATKGDSGKPRPGLIDPAFRLAMGRVLAHGEKKYGPANWMDGLAHSRLIDATERHLLAYQSGEDRDHETGESHLVHAACSLMMLHWKDSHENGKTDDRRYKEGQVPRVWQDEATGELRPEPSREIRQSLSALLEPDQVPAQEERPEQELKRRLREVLERSAGTDIAPRVREAKEDPVRELQKRITQWADLVFPDRTAHNALCKLIMEEIPELLHGGLDDPMEYADVLILILDVASLRGIDAIAAAHRKMDINERRSWEIDAESGLMRHREGTYGC